MDEKERNAIVRESREQMIRAANKAVEKADEAVRQAKRAERALMVLLTIALVSTGFALVWALAQTIK